MCSKNRKKALGETLQTRKRVRHLSSGDSVRQGRDHTGFLISDGEFMLYFKCNGSIEGFLMEQSHNLYHVSQKARWLL